MDKYKKYFDNEDESLLEKINVAPSKLYMKNYVPDIKAYTSPLEEVSKNLLKSKIDTKSLSAIHNVSKSYVKTLTPVTDYYKSAMNFSSIKPDIGKAIKVTMIQNNIDLSGLSKEISKPILMSESYSNMIESIKNVTSTSLIGTKFIEKMDFNIPNIGMESSLRISNSFKELLEDYPVKIDIDIPSLEESLDQTNINFSKPSEMTNFILQNTENAEPLTVEEAETIDFLIEAKDENEIVEVYEKSIEKSGIDNKLLISYLFLFTIVILSSSDPKIREFLFETISTVLLAPSIMDIKKKTNKLLEPRDDEASKNDNSKE